MTEISKEMIEAACEAQAIAVAQQDGITLTPAGFRHGATARPEEHEQMREYVAAGIRAAVALLPSEAGEAVTWIAEHKFEKGRHWLDEPHGQGDANWSDAFPVYRHPPVQPSVGVPEGWQLVPVTPTKAMQEKGRWGGITPLDENRCVNMAGIWKAMLAASPTPPAAQDKSGIELLEAYRDELLMISREVGEPDDPFSAWETVYLLKDEVERLKRINADHCDAINTYIVSKSQLQDRAEKAEAANVAAQDDLERMRALLDTALQALDNYADPTGYTDSYGDQVPADAETHQGLLAKDTAATIRAALSRDASRDEERRQG